MLSHTLCQVNPLSVVLKMPPGSVPPPPGSVPPPPGSVPPPPGWR